MGKTTLALKLAQQLTTQYPDAQFYLDLRGTSDTPLTPAQAMAHVIRAYHPTVRLPDTETGLSALYHSVLHDQRALLVMDNASGKEQVTSLLPPDRCVLLVTSRTRFALPGLKALNLDTLPARDAQALLLKISPRVGGGAGEMAELCGYLPLALRLAGSVLAEREDLQPEDYLRRLADAKARLGLVEASLSLSYDVLYEELRRLWCALAVFPGTFDLAAAVTVWQMEQDAAQDALGELVRHSLVEWNPDTSRYRLHDLARLFARDRLPLADHCEAQRCHAIHYRTVAASANDLYVQGGEFVVQGLAQFDKEWHNIKVAQTWAAGHAEQDETAMRLCRDYPNTAIHCLTLRLHEQERIRWLRPAIKAAQMTHDRVAEGCHIGELGNAYLALGQVWDAIAYYGQALDIAREIGDSRRERNHLGNLGKAYRELGQVSQSVEYHQQALALSREMGDSRDESIALDNLGSAYRLLGQAQRAIGCHRQALAIVREVRDRRGEGASLGNLGLDYARLGETEPAIECFERALEIAQEIGDRGMERSSLAGLGIAYHALGNVKRATDCSARALAIARDIGDRRAEAHHSWDLGLLCEETDPAQAVELMSVRVVYERELGHPDADAHTQRVAQVRARFET